MKLNKNTGVKASIVAVAAAVFVGLMALIHASPQIHVEASAAPAVTPEAQPTPDFGGFFRDGRDGRDDRDDDGGSLVPQTQPQAQSQLPSTTSVRPHTRTRGS